MRLPFTEKFLWDMYKAAKFTAGALDKLGRGRYRGLRGAREIIKFLSYPDYLDLKKLEQKKLGKERFGRLIEYLKYNGYLYVRKTKNKEGIFISSKGAGKILDIKNKIEGRPIRKDGKWQMIIFDIPEKLKKRRDYLRDGLTRLKYRKLQQSVWICPYDVFRETKELIEYFKLEPFVITLLTEEISIR
ncbi:MAG: hypothetical protein Q8N59_01065 [bacterium]|nr:hypothetical protein [bacterium]